MSPITPIRKLWTELVRKPKDDTANLAVPAHLLAPYSSLEMASCYGERPSQFAGLGQEPDKERRAVLVLKWMLTSMKSQFYGPGATQTQCLERPLDAFLGEVFRARWTDGRATCRLVAEQVSRHPPVAAAWLYDDENGVRASLYARTEMRFPGTLELRPTGHLMLRLAGFDEEERHLCYLPGCAVRGVGRGGAPVPEVAGTYHIISSSGYVSEVTFSGASFLGAAFRGKDAFRATTYASGPDRKPLYVAQGYWSGRFTITRTADGEVVHDWDPSLPENALSEAEVRPISKQDCWESRRAWKPVVDALRSGDLDEAVAEKSKLKKAQRKMRAAEQECNVSWRPLLFFSEPEDNTFCQLAFPADVGWKLEADKTEGVWKADPETVKCLSRPFRAGDTPMARVLPADKVGVGHS